MSALVIGTTRLGRPKTGRPTVFFFRYWKKAWLN
jgi:hypothetical protein